MDTNKIFFLGTERMDMNSLVPFRPVAQGRIELGHALTETNRRIDHRNRINLAFGCPYRIAVDSHSLPTTNAGRYCSDRAELANLYVHLTNVAIQKKANDYDKEVGCKWDLRSLKVREPRVSTIVFPFNYLHRCMP